VYIYIPSGPTVLKIGPTVPILGPSKNTQFLHVLYVTSCMHVVFGVVQCAVL
jgi:hypothetical protein